MGATEAMRIITEKDLWDWNDDPNILKDFDTPPVDLFAWMAENHLKYPWLNPNYVGDPNPPRE